MNPEPQSQKTQTDRPEANSQARLDSVLETAVDGIIVIDEKARILAYNRACETLFGYRARDVLGENVKIIMPESYAREHDQYVSNYVQGGAPKIIGIGREVRGRAKDGTEFPIELSVGVAETSEGRQFIGIMRDLRSRKAAEERVQQLQTQLVHMARVSAIDEMGAALAHELNQPLTAVLLYLQAIRRKFAEDEALDTASRDILDKAVREAERAGQIIQRMRQFVEKQAPERKSVDVSLLIEEAIELVLLGRVARSIEVERCIPEPVPMVEVDPVQIQQIFVNLLRNAVEAIAQTDKKRLRIEMRRTENVLHTDICDSGPGIAPHIAAELFNAFSSSKTGGLGLGLAISKSIAQSHGGDLTVEPGGNGSGAVFTVSLPIVRQDDDAGVNNGPSA